MMPPREVIADVCNRHHDTLMQLRGNSLGESFCYEGPPIFGRHYANMVLRALDDNGYIIIPREPTDCMLSGGATKLHWWWQDWGAAKSKAASIYEIMIGRAPLRGPEP